MGNSDNKTGKRWRVSYRADSFEFRRFIAKHTQLSWKTIVVRGFIPDRLRSSREIIEHGMPDLPSCLVLGWLRHPSGINPLATNALKVPSGAGVKNMRQRFIVADLRFIK
jgi:hypothetical protein